MLEKIKAKYGKDLPGKSAFRNDPEAPCTVEEISEEFGSWDIFVVKYNTKVQSTPTKKPAATKTTKEVKTNAAKE